jgi:hypothetical protein
MFSVFALTSRANPNILAELMQREQWWDSKFGRWVAPNFIQNGGGMEEVGSIGPDAPKWTGAPIELHEEFIKLGHTALDIPVQTQLTERPIFGDKALKGTAERARIVFRSVPVNYTRKAYAPPTGMSYQVVKKYADDLVFSADKQLRTFWRHYHPGNFILTMLAGASLDLIAPADEGGRAVPLHSHPNFFVAGQGQVSFTGNSYTNLPFTDAYEADVATALAGLNSIGGPMTVALIENMAVVAPRKSINRIVTQKGFDFYPLWMSDAQWKQLQRDPEFREMFKQMPPGFSGEPLATGCVAFIAGCAIYTDLNLFGARIHDTDPNVPVNTVRYGIQPELEDLQKGYTIGNWVPNLDTSNLKIAMLLGQGAMSVGVGERMVFTELIDDHEFVKEIGVRTIQSVVRSDILDFDGLTGLAAGSFYRNTSSLVVATKSPHGLLWS